jgi:signal transduction histidine kinase
MKKHSNANLVVISCKKENKFLNISYADNGVGFQNNEVVFKNGLKNMETRIKGIGGTFSFDSASEKGCKVKIRFKN